MADFWDGLSKSCLMVLLSEIGDKTFFIAAVMAMRNPRGEVRRVSFRVHPLERRIHV